MSIVFPLYILALVKAVVGLGYATAFLWTYPGLMETRLPVYMACVLANGFMGTLLFFGGSNRSAGREFGVLFLLIASPYAGACLAVIERLHGADALQIFGFLQVDAFAPYIFWLFAGMYPAARLSQRKTKFYEIAKTLSLWVGIVLFTANFVMFLGQDSPYFSSEGWLGIVHRFSYPSLYWPLVFGTLIPAIVFLLLRIPGSEPTAKRRLNFLAISVAVGLMPMFLITIAHNVSIAAREFLLSPEAEPFTFLFVDVFMLSLPLTAGYSLLAHRVFSLRYVFTVGAQYAALRYAVLLALVGPMFIVGLVILVNQNLTIAELTDQYGIAILGCLLISGLAIGYEKPLLELIDRRFLNNTFDTQSVVIQLTSGLSTVDNLESFADVIQTSLEDAISTDRARVLLLDSFGSFSSTSADVDPLDGSSRLGSLLKEDKTTFELSVDFDRVGSQLEESDKY